MQDSVQVLTAVWMVALLVLRDAERMEGLIPPYTGSKTQRVNKPLQNNPWFSIQIRPCQPILHQRLLFDCVHTR